MLLQEFDPAETPIFSPSMVCQPIPGMPKVAVSCFSYVTFERLPAASVWIWSAPRWRR